jgi:hypothetical protein
MEISTMGSGQMTRPTDSVFTCMSTAQSTRVCGATTCNTAREWRPGLMAQSTRESMHSVASTESDSISGTMVPNISGNGRKTRSQA